MKIRMNFSECGSDDKFKLNFLDHGNDHAENVGFEDSTQVTISNDYDDIKNKPKINHVVIEGDVSLSDLGLRAVYYDTKANWNAHTSMISEAGAIYIYSDYKTVYDEVDNPSFIPGIKIGDGTSYLIDMPFVSDAMTMELLRHMNNAEVHITQAERTFWNNKVSSFLDAEDTENLILSKTNFAQGDIYYG